MRRYEKYKSSKEAVWYNSIPVNWVSTKMRKVFSERREKVSDKDYPFFPLGKWEWFLSWTLLLKLIMGITESN